MSIADEGSIRSHARPSRRDILRAARAGLLGSIFWLATLTLLGLIDLWERPRSNGELYMFGVQVRHAGHHSISYSPGGIAWWFLGLPIAAGLLRMRRRSARDMSRLWWRVAVAAVALLLVGFALIVPTMGGAH